MASLLFGDAIDVVRLRVHNRRYLPLLQPGNCAMTPNGSIYFHQSCFLPDCARAIPRPSSGSGTRRYCCANYTPNCEDVTAGQDGLTFFPDF
jgi:hypothetical protein